MAIKRNYEFVVVKKSYTYATCPMCEGEGIKKRTFRKMTYVQDCPACEGEGRKRFTITEEFPLSEAIKELQSST